MSTNKRKTVYVGMSADLIHPGHLNILREAKKYGDVIVGLLTDKAIASYKRLPCLNFSQRLTIIESLKDVHSVIAQDTLDYRPNLLKIKPDYVLHGDDWLSGPQKIIRQQVIETLAKWGGVVIDIKYTEGISSSILNSALKEIGVTPNTRMQRLKRLIDSKSLVRIIEAHNGISGLIVENTSELINGVEHEFDGIWSSSLTDSASRGKPDIEAVDISSRIQSLNDILEVTTKPIIFDGDTGGRIEHFIYTVRTLERHGVSAIVIEDKVGLKRNSLLEDKTPQFQESKEDFCKKIIAGKKARITNDFMIIARCESLILNSGMNDALERCNAYIDAGADGILIHSKKSSPDEIFEFCKLYNRFTNKVPLIVVPTTYNCIYEDELINAGVNVVIYANQLFRSAYPAMVNAAKSILRNQRSLELDEKSISINNLLNIIPANHQ